jgi:hypothetical protein
MDLLTVSCCKFLNMRRSKFAGVIAQLVGIQSCLIEELQLLVYPFPNLAWQLGVELGDLAISVSELAVINRTLKC